MEFVKTGPTESGIIKIEVLDEGRSCGNIVFRVQADGTIGISFISCVCPQLRGKCMKVFLFKLIEHFEEEGTITDATKVDLFVEPDYREGVSPRQATRKLKAHYARVGFANDPAEPDLPEYMISTIGKIKEHIMVQGELSPSIRSILGSSPRRTQKRK